jgi:hypothetical protein
MKNMTDSLYVEPNRKVQIILVLTIIAAGFVFASVDTILIHFRPTANASKEDIEIWTSQLSFLLFGMLIVFLVVQICCICYLVCQGFRTLKQSRYPPIGAVVVWRTRVRSARAAKIMGFLTIGFSIALAFTAIQVCYVFWILLSSL